MTYCTLNDIKQLTSEAELIQLTDDDDTGIINESIVNSAISYAETTINGYISSRYTLPLSEIPELIKTFSVDLSIYRLHSRRFMLDMPESLEIRYKNIIKELEKIQKGMINLNIKEPDNTEKVADHNEFYCSKTSEDRLFPKSLLDKY